MRARQTQQATQIVKINLAGPKRRRRAKKTVRTINVRPEPDVRPEPIPFFGRMGPQVEPIRVQRAEEPRQLRIEDFRENFVPPPAFRQYISSLIEQPRMRVEEVKEDRVEAPKPPLIQTGPLAGMSSASSAASSSTTGPSSRVVFEEEELSPAELFSMRERGGISNAFLSALPISSKKEGLSLVKVASMLGLVVPSAIQRGGKARFVAWILENM